MCAHVCACIHVCVHVHCWYALARCVHLFPVCDIADTEHNAKHHACDHVCMYIGVCVLLNIVHLWYRGAFYSGHHWAQLAVLYREVFF